MRRSTAYSIVFAFGIGAGLLFYAAAYALVEGGVIPRPTYTNETIPNTALYRHSGIVIAHDMEKHTLTVREQGRFDTATSTALTRFTYDDGTLWSSIGYRFRHGIYESRVVATDEAVRYLPEGTLVTLVREMTAGESNPWRLAHIAFLRRDDL